MDESAAIAPPGPDEAAAPPHSQQRYFNRELSWLAFNRRVLEEACNPHHPLLERVRFLSISGSNLDEFFMVRVAGLKAHQLLGVEELSADGLTPTQQLDAIKVEADALVASQQQVWRDLREALLVEGINVVGEGSVDQESGKWLDRYFREQNFPLLTPQAINPAHPFPFIPNGSFSLIFELKRKGHAKPIREILTMPAAVPRFVRLPGKDSKEVETSK